MPMRTVLQYLKHGEKGAARPLGIGGPARSVDKAMFTIAGVYRNFALSEAALI
jgi:hypothetical protein